MLYLPRLFVYHCEAEPGSKQSETFKVMERRLLKAIINPAMIATWIFGLWLVWLGGFEQVAAGCMPSSRWCIVLSGMHGWLSRLWRDFAYDRNRHSQKFYRYHQ